MNASNHHSKTKLVILGTGFGAFSLLKNLAGNHFDITVVSPRNHFLFTPLLPSTTVGTLEFRSIIEPIRSAKKEITYVQAYCTTLDVEQKSIQCESAIDTTTFNVPFDILVIAVGAVHNTFGIPGVQEHALFLKELNDAREIRNRIIENLEHASQPNISHEERKRLLHFVVVGGGPTGVEFAAELHDFIEEDLSKAYLQLLPFIKISLLEAGEHLLNSFDSALRTYTEQYFQRNNIEVSTKSFVTKIDTNTIYLKDGSEIPYGCLVWSTGIAQTDFVKSLPFAKDKSSRILVNEHLQIPNVEAIYALGDCATPNTITLPATSQVALQEGKYVAKTLKLLSQGKPIRQFRYHHLGMLAYIGSNKALADLENVKGKGFSTWLFWRSAYLTKLVSMKNKILVMFDWTKTIIFGRDISRF